MQNQNSKILFCDFILECQVIEEFLIKIVSNISKKDKKNYKKFTMGQLINELESLLQNCTFIEDLRELKDKRNDLVHETALQILKETEKLKIKNVDKDKIINSKFIIKIKEAQNLNDKCFQNLIEYTKN
jgi:hypothetical protein